MKPPLEYQIEEYLEWILNCQNGNIPKLKSILVNGYDINTNDYSGYNGLYHSINSYEISTSLFLIEQGIEFPQTELN